MMPSFFCVSNLLSQSVVPCLPYEFNLPAEISDAIRTNKKSRQEFYKNPATVHQFYSGIEGCNPNQRISKNNPPHKIHAVIADVDLPLDAERIAAVLNTMKLMPSWVERSLGGNCRLIWILSRPILVDTLDFSTFILQQARNWLQLDLLPGLDAKALEDPTRLYCNGVDWVATGAPPVPENAVQAFFVECGQKYLFKDCGSDVEIPLDICEKKLRERYPSFNWPGSFENGSSGPSFWVEGSTSANSAICKKFGMFSFAAHAAKPFYSWSELLGADFAVEFRTNCLATATAEKYWDGKSYWYMNEAEGRFVSASREVLINHLQVRCRVSRKPDKSGSSMMDRCLEHIHTFGHCDGGAPILFSPLGLTLYNGIKLVNSSPKSKIILPSGVPSAWGEAGNFPFISAVLTALFDPVEPQLEYFLAWLRYFYVAAWKQKPSPGQNIFLAGIAGCGKSLTNREICGGLLGGFVDSGRYLSGDVSFNSSLFISAVWSVDDSQISDSETARRKFSSCIKACAANADFEYRRKFENSVMIPFMGRVICTLNLDASSTRSLPILDDAMMQKVSFFRCASVNRFVFPDRETIKNLLKAELPNLAQFLVDSKTPDELLGEARYGVKAYHAPELTAKSHQATRSAPFSEILVEMLTRWFSDHPDATEFCASCTQILRLLYSDPLNSEVLRTVKIESVNRYCEEISRQGVISCTSHTGPRKTRVWCFPRFV